MRSLRLAVVLLLALPCAAQGETVVAVGGGDLNIRGQGEGSNLTVQAAGAQLRVSDANATVNPGSGCSADGANAALCSTAGVTRIDAQMGDAPDQVTIDPAITTPAVILGGTANDTLRGAAGDDRIDGESGDDVVQGFGGADLLIGGDGVDTATYEERGGAIAVTLNDGIANDGDQNPVEGDEVRTEQATGGAGKDSLTGDDGRNSLLGVGGDDTIRGLGGADYVDGGFATLGADRIFGGAGNDTVEGHDGDDHLEGGEGNDFVRGFGGSDVALGGDGSDRVVDWEDNFRPDDLDGGPGDDQVDPTTGGGEVLGGPGNDRTNLQGIGGTTMITLAGGADDTGSNGTYDVQGFEHVDLAGGNDTITGTDANETFFGHGGDDVLRGMGGDDFLKGHGGNDETIGGPGTDMSDFNDVADCTITLDGVANDTNSHTHSGLADNADTENVIGCHGGTTVLTGSDGPNLMIGQGGPDTINGLGGDDVLQGEDNNDVLNGGDGDDILRGGNHTDDVNGDAGDDRLEHGGGADDMDGGPGFDLADYRSVTPGGVTVTLDDTANDADGDNVKTEAVRGGFGPDTITGGPGDETLLGGPGDDDLFGGGGGDLLLGQGGADLLDGQDGIDRADFTAAGGPIAVSLNALPDDGYEGEGDDVRTEQVLGGDFDDVLVGDGAANLLTGGPGADEVDGAGGDDTLVGGPGGDTLTSGPGADWMRALDGEADVLACDVVAGKIVEADAADAGCGQAGPGGGPAPGGDVPIVDLGPPPFSPFPPGVDATPAPGPRSGADLRRALVGEPRSLILGAGENALDLGDVDCTDSLQCTATVTVRKVGGKPKRRRRGGRSRAAQDGVLARGRATGTGGSLSAAATLTAAGREALRKRGRKVRAQATIVLTEGTTRVSITHRFVVRRAR